jgi:hypothetical protein
VPTIYRQSNWKIVMYFADHGAPHFHIRTPNGEAKVAIETLELVAGSIDSKTRGVALAWARNHRELLCRRWRELSEEE